MATAKKPGATRRAAQAQAAADMTMSFEYDGETFTIRPNDVSAKITGQLRRNTGFSMIGLMSAAQQDFDSDVVAALLYLARRQRGENCSYDQIAESITLGTTAESFVDLEQEPDEEEDPNLPET
jgi:hypothetical protein